MRLSLFMNRLRALGIELTLGADRSLLVDCPADIADAALLDEIREYKPEILKRLRHEIRDKVCEHCGTSDSVAVPIHEGRSTRLDCARCGRFLRFSVWQPRPKN